MANWKGNKALEKRLIELHARGKTFGDIAVQLSEEFEQEFSIKSVDSRLFVLREEGKLEEWIDTASIGFLDIETSNFDANAGFMMSWSMVLDGEIYGDLISRAEIVDGYGDDRRITESLIRAMRECDAVATFWGTGFDIPYIRSRALDHKLEFPYYGSIAHLDLFYACRSLFKLHRRSLDAVCRFLGIEGKAHLDLRIWNKARVGHIASLAYVYEHNISDVEILAKLWTRIKPYRKWLRKSI